MTNPLPIDRDQIGRFVKALLCNLDPEGFVSLRAFRQFPPKGERDTPLHIEPIKLNTGLEPVIDAAARIAERVSNGGEPAVFAPPVCTFASRKGARSSDLLEAPVLSIEIDRGDLQHAADTFTLILGVRPTLALHSGSLWSDPESGEMLPKGHLHWRLLTPARTPDQHHRLRRARVVAALLAGGDPTATHQVHPLRWPGSWNRKSQPVMARIIEENTTTIDLDDALAALEDAAELAGIKPPAAVEHDIAAGTSAAPAPQIAEWLSYYPTAGLSWPDWNNVGMACFRATDGSSEGYEAFRAWSANSEHYDEAGCRTRWQAYRTSPPTWIGANYLRRKAAEHGWTEPEPEVPEPELPPPGDPPNGPPPPPVEPPNGLPPPTFEPPGRPVIRVQAGILHLLADQAEAALLRLGAEIYQRGVLVRPAVVDLPAADNHKTQSAFLTELKTAAITDDLCRAARWVKWNERKKGYVPTDPPDRVAEIVLARAGRWRFDYVRGIISTPAMRPDGSLITKPGLDPLSGFYLALPAGFRLPAIPEQPSKGEAIAALNLLERLLDEFPFVEDGGVSHSVALSGLMTPVVRTAMAVAPLHGFSATTIASGKSFLVDLAAMIATGRLCPVAFLGTSNEELDKKLNGLLLGGVPLISLDNARRPLDTDLLCQACERPLLELRRLGKSDTFTTPNGASIYATGNNLELAGEMIRRTLRATMDVGIERPENRVFKGDPIGAVLADRGKYVAAILTVIRAYLAAGRPSEQAPLASYGDWCRLVREPLIWLGKADPVKSQETVRELDPVLIELREVMAVWERMIGLNDVKTVLQVVKLADEPMRGSKEADEDWQQRRQQCLELRDVLIRVAGERGAISTRRLGFWLRSRNGRVVCNRRFVSPGSSGGVARWKLEAR